MSPGMVRWAAALLLAGACNQVFDIKRTALSPEAPADQDADGVDDVDDNCLEVPNPTQSDDDADGLGDACDNCPLVANPEQDNIGDGDPIGDLCDPHPANDGDCLVLYDTFTDPNALASNWMLATGADGVHPGAGEVRVDASHTAPATLFALDASGAPITGPHAVELLARVIFTATDAPVEAVTSFQSAIERFACGVELGGSPLRTFVRYAYGYAGNSSISPMSSVRPFGELMSLRLVPDDVAGALALGCRVDFGISLGIANTKDVSASQGGTGMYTEHPATFLGIGIYRYQPGQACPPAVFR